LHHVLLGVDRCVVIDNGSSDGTTELLLAIAQRVPRVEVRLDASDFIQERWVNAVANEFCRKQETLVIPFDADEFWDAPISALSRQLELNSANTLTCRVINFIQSRSVAKPTRFHLARALRIADTVFPYNSSSVTERRCAFVELAYPRKVLFRAEGEVAISKGAHDVSFAGKKAIESERFACLHLPLRSKQEIEVRALDYEPRRIAHRRSSEESWQSMHFADVIRRGEAEAEWSANSYGVSGMLDVFGQRRPTRVDLRLLRRIARAYAYALFLRLPLGPTKPA
jgi:hypothetical protein